MRRILAALLTGLPLLAHGGSLADVEVYDRTRGKSLTLHRHGERLYIVGEPGHQYELRIRSRSPQRLLAVTSVDGVNVITGETAATDQRGYVLDRWATVHIEGWRKSLDEVATFYFTSLPDSYAARTGRPDDVGVVGVAMFRERVSRGACCEPRHDQRAQAAPEAAAEGQAADAESMRSRTDERIGTGHGQRESSPAEYVDFERASHRPDEVIRIYYDSRRNLMAQGVLPHRPRPVKHAPDAFPAGFVPDP